MTLARVMSHDGLVYTLGNRYPDGSFWRGGSQPWTNGIPGYVSFGATPTNQDAGATNGAGFRAVTVTPAANGRFLLGGKIYGYRDLDLQATKHFKLYGTLSGYVRVDLINVFNWENPVGYIENFGSGGIYQPRVRYNPTGDITGYPRTLRATLGVSF